MRHIFGGILVTLFIVALTCSSLWAQATAQISGTVKDQSGAVLPGVEIHMTQTDTGVSRDAVTNETGSYVLTNLPIGRYRMEASLPGFRTYAQTGIVLEVNASPTINPVLAVGQVSEQVEVQSNAAQVETGATGIQTGVKADGSVSLGTTSATNQWHGAAFEFVRNFAFNARNAFAPSGDGLKRNQFGGTLGGAIRQNKLFFFTGYQQTMLRITPSDQASVVPTAAMMVGDFTAYTSPACNGGRQIPLRAPFVNNRVAPSQLSPAALKLAKAMNPSQDPC